jgi:hypothetical protein
MPVYVLHKGRLIDKRHRPASTDATASSAYPAPAVQSFESYQSPATGEPVSSLRQRERDLNNSGSYDPRDTPETFRKARHARRQPKRTPREPSGYR